MIERPIPMSAPMVRALLAGTKTQTRRVVRKQFAPDAIVAEVGATTPEGWQVSGHSGLWWDDAGACLDDAVRCPYGMPGDQLWVREAWRTSKVADELRPSLLVGGDYSPIWYEAQDEVPFHPSDFGKLRPSMFMPRWASRITLEVTGVRVERLQDISEAGAKAEGITPREVRQMWLYGADEEKRADIYKRAAVGAYRDLWEEINGTDSWGSNPWVWVVEFKRVKP